MGQHRDIADSIAVTAWNISRRTSCKRMSQQASCLQPAHVYPAGMCSPPPHPLPHTPRLHPVTLPTLKLGRGKLMAAGVSAYSACSANILSYSCFRKSTWENAVVVVGSGRVLGFV